MNRPTLRLYELTMANGRSASPYVWRIRYALAHKGLAFESVPLGFTEIATTFGGRHRTVPVLEHGADWVCDSWLIAAHLDAAFPDAKPLFSSPGEMAAVRLTDEWYSSVLMRKLFALYALDIFHAVRPADREYYRRTREARTGGKTLEAYTADRAGLLPAVREALQPLRQQLGRGAFLGGEAPTYADYVALGGLLWVASVSTLPLLESGDAVLRGWWERCLDLYGGVGHDTRLKPLFES